MNTDIHLLRYRSLRDVILSYLDHVFWWIQSSKKFDRIWWIWIKSGKAINTQWSLWRNCVGIFKITRKPYSWEENQLIYCSNRSLLIDHTFFQFVCRFMNDLTDIFRFILTLYCAWSTVTISLTLLMLTSDQVRIFLEDFSFTFS